MTTTIQEAMGKFAGQHRPLRNLTKEHLFIYPQADPSQEAGFKFAREIIHRRAAHDAVKRAVDLAKERLDEAHLKMVRNPDAQAAYEKQVAMRKRELAAAQAELDSLPANEGALSHEEVQAHYRGKHLAEYEQMIAKWKELSLFTAQQFGWTAFLTCDRDTRHGDNETFKVVQALAAFCGEDKNKDFLEILALHTYRIAPSMGSRRQYLDEEGNLKTPASLEKDLQRGYWDAWRAYNTATFTHKWPDDSGVAYDERQFKITKTEED